MTPEDDLQTWSNLTIDEIVAHMNKLKMRIPYLSDKLSVRYARNSTRGADVTIALTDESGTVHHLLIEVEQYASGGRIERKISGWANRHHADENTTTVVISLVMQALFNRLIGDFSQNNNIRRMVYSKNFRIYPGSGDGKLLDDLKFFITVWIEERL